MSSQTKPAPSHPDTIQSGILCVIGLACCLSSGCQDGPLYALKNANPYYTMEWKRDDAIGVTDHERREELGRLAETIHSMPKDKQKFWAGHLEKLIENDDSPRNAAIGRSRSRTPERSSGDRNDRKGTR